MRSLTTRWIFVIGLIMSWPALVSAEAWPSNGLDENDAVHSDAADEDSDESADEDRDDQDIIREAWSRYFAPPMEHQWELEASLGWMFWQTAYGGFQGRRYGRGRLRRLWRGPLATSLAVDFTRHAPTAGTIDFRDHRVALSAAAGLHWWLGRWLLGLDLESGALLTRRSIADGHGQSVSSSRLLPLVGTATRAGVSVYGTASISIEAGLRWHPERLDRLIVTQFAWLW